MDFLDESLRGYSISLLPASIYLSSAGITHTVPGRYVMGGYKVVFTLGLRLSLELGKINLDSLSREVRVNGEKSVSDGGKGEWCIPQRSQSKG